MNPLNLGSEETEEIRDLKSERDAPVYLELPVVATWQRTAGGL